MRILVVDDSEDARDVLAATLMSGGYDDVVCATSGADALARLAATEEAPTEPVDVILLDVMMPEMDGIEVCASIRADARYQDVPILMVTAATDKNLLSHAFVAGASDYVTKPYDRTELLTRIRTALKLKGELDRRRAREVELSTRGPVGEVPHPVADVPIDAPTGLFGYQSVDTLLRSDRPARIAGVVVFRIDGMARFRTRYGQAGEDELARRIADGLRTLPARLGDQFARYGNDLFVALLCSADAASLRALADEARRLVSSLKIANPDSPVSPYVTLSVGAALCDGGSGDVRSTFAKALGAADSASTKGDTVVIEEGSGA